MSFDQLPIFQNLGPIGATLRARRRIERDRQRTRRPFTEQEFDEGRLAERRRFG
jgi:hypothetical protein